MALLERMTLDVIQKAFEKTKSQIQFPEGEPVLVDERNMEDAIAIMRDHFFPDDPLGVATDQTLTPDMRNICLAIFQSKISFLVLDRTSREPIAARFMRVNRRVETMTADMFTDPSLKMLVGLIDIIEEKANIFERFQVDEAIQFFGMCVRRDKRRRGIGTKLVEFSIQFVKNLGIRPICIRGEPTSKFSIRIYEKSGLRHVVTMDYAGYQKDGRPVMKTVPGEDVCCVYAAKYE
ncbi:arylalkylamine N-acetyltransferase-like 2 [Dreissena polymorpha]|uniref:N-acetyltransferase domain-containing protein n=1 Tax=Dreissena polymorpha TaxID=45954 RepID=A0A9D4IGU8_DREPO|nr:arylalkylamine N-acetyltransferase-like 2 [Dreissena polymorpha]KAH3771363.1 hypothetical protein DPMN_172679 [Dreissena polymorpha]